MFTVKFYATFYDMKYLTVQVIAQFPFTETDSIQGVGAARNVLSNENSETLFVVLCQKLVPYGIFYRLVVQNSCDYFRSISGSPLND